jgi:coatomer protein complex subunit alpha (xenin)
MVARFHPTQDLIVSASLDQTVRVWDISGLRKRHSRGHTIPSLSDSSMGGGSSGGSGGGGGPSSGSSPGMGGGGGVGGDGSVKTDMFGGSTDVAVKFVLEGHERGVNWASFHPTEPLIVTAADDRSIRLWRYNENKAWQVGPLRGHSNNVSCVSFFKDFIVSDSEDKTIKIWDTNKRICLKTFKRPEDRFWVLTVHPTRNLIAAGHDTGLLVFKLERERPAYDVYNGALYRCKDGYIRYFNGSQEVSLTPLRKDDSAVGSVKTLLHPNALLVNRMNQDSVDVLVCGPGASVELVSFAGAGEKNKEPVSKFTNAVCAVFTARNRYAVLDEQHSITIRNFSNEVTKKFTTQHPPDWMYPGGLPGRVILRAEDRVTLFDTQSQRIVHEVSASKIKAVVWASDASHVCLISKRHVVVCTRDLEHCCTVSESIRVKSACWTLNNEVLVYATLKHIKYLLPNGDVGVLRSLDEPLYIVRIEGEVLYVLDRDQQLKTLKIDTTEFRFKVALAQGKFKEVMHMIQTAGMCGEAIVGYLEDKGFPEVALHFAEDDATRFMLAVECGQLAVAKECAEKLQSDDSWRRLAEEALRAGNVSLAELAMQKTRDLSKLSFLYCVTGNMENLAKMQIVAERQKDPDSRMHNALLRCDPVERVKVFEQVGQLALAWVCAETFGLKEEAARLAQRLTDAKVPIPTLPVVQRHPGGGGITLVRTRAEILGGKGVGDWPLLAIAMNKSTGAGDFVGATTSIPGEDGGAAEEELDAALVQPNTMVHTSGNANSTAFNNNSSSSRNASPRSFEGKTGSGGNVIDTAAWDDDEDLDIEEELAPVVAATVPSSTGNNNNRRGSNASNNEEQHESFFAAVQPGIPTSTKWVQNSTLAFDHAAAGSFSTAMKLLNNQIGVVNFAPLKPLMLQAYASSRVLLPGPPSVDAAVSYLTRLPTGEFPLPIFTLQSAASALSPAYEMFVNMKFQEALGLFKRVLQMIPMVVVSKEEEILQLQEILAYAREYTIAIMLRLAYDALPADGDKQAQIRAAELASYLTRRDLQPAHLMLVVKVAMAKAFKLDNYITAAGFARRLLAMPGIDHEKHLKLKTDAQKVLQKSEREGRNAVELKYSDAPFDLDVVSLVSTPAGSCLKCPYCQSTSTQRKVLCPVCELSPIGVETLGLVAVMGSSKR